MTVLVTGGTGLLGSHVVDLLLERDESVRALVWPGEDASPLARSGVETVVGDLADGSGLEDAVRGVDLVLHCAAITGGWGDRALYEAVNVRGTLRLVELALEAGSLRIVHVSSITVHGNDVHGIADETSAIRVEPNPYSWSKVEAERRLHEIVESRGAPITVVRPGWIYGPRDRNSFGRFAEMIRRGKMIVVGAGNNNLPLVYVRDVANGVILAGTSDRAVGETYLLVGDEPVTQMRLSQHLASELGVPRPSRHVPYRLALALGLAAETAGKPCTGLSRRSLAMAFSCSAATTASRSRRPAVSLASCRRSLSPRGSDRASPGSS